MAGRGIIHRVVFLAVGLLAVPLCIITTAAVWSLFGSVQPSSYSAIPATAVAMLAGFGVWVLIYFVLPRPIRTYVLAHELTHALWAFLSGASVSRFRLSKDGGSVMVSKNNILITLAPYFFPLYTILVLCIHFVLSLFYDVGKYELVWLWLVGFTWGFHLTFTVSTLLEHQTDIAEYGHVLSYAVIYLFNALGVGLWIIGVTRATLEQFVGLLCTKAGAVWETLVALMGN